MHLAISHQSELNQRHCSSQSNCMCRLTMQSLKPYSEAFTQGHTIMKNLFYIISALFLFIGNVALADSADKLSVQASSAWTNQSGSTLYIDGVSLNGQITGHYINRAQGYNCQNISYPVTGWIYGSAITFTTIWQSTTESCNSITSWTGFYYNGQISTLWQLVMNGATNTSQILQGSDTFTPTVMMNKKSLLNAK